MSSEEQGRGSTHKTDEAESPAVRVRKSKKPEIQIYRPGALRQKRSNQSSEKSITDSTATNVPDSKVETKSLSGPENVCKSSEKARHTRYDSIPNQNDDSKAQIKNRPTGTPQNVKTDVKLNKNKFSVPDYTNNVEKDTRKAAESGSSSKGREKKSRVRDSKPTTTTTTTLGNTPEIKGKQQQQHSNKPDNKNHSEHPKKKREERINDKFATDKESLNHKKSEKVDIPRWEKTTSKIAGEKNRNDSFIAMKETKDKECIKSHEPSTPNEIKKTTPLKNEKIKDEGAKISEKKVDKLNMRIDVKHKGTFIESPANINDKDMGRFKESVRKGNEGKHQRNERVYESRRNVDKGSKEKDYDYNERSSDKQYKKSSSSFSVERYTGYDHYGEDDGYNMSVQNLANKVDELVLKTGQTKKKGRARYNNSDDTREIEHRMRTPSERPAVERTPDQDDRIKVVDKGDSKMTLSKSDREQTEKNNKAKSYSSVRENRRNRMGGKSTSQHQSNQGEELKIEVKIDKNTPGRTAYLRQGSDHEKSETGSRYRLAQECSREEASLLQQFSENSTSQNLEELEKDDINPLIFVDVPENAENDWGTEVDNDNTSWCIQSYNATHGKASSWESERTDRRKRRERQCSESEDFKRRTESPGCRGVIQLPAPGSNDISTTSNSSAQQFSTSTPFVQKQLYNPNNPSKPVLVVPSARDLPPSRDTQRDNEKGTSETMSGTSSTQSSQLNEYVSEGQSSKLDPSLLYNIQKGEMDINYYVSSNQLPFEFRRIMDIRHHLQVCYKQMLVTDIRMCQEKNMEGSMWKTLYYVIIEKLREYISREPGLKDRSLATLLMLVEEGHKYLNDLLEALQREYGFTLEDHLEDGGTSNSGTRSRVRMALVSAQKILLSLGDLARYREQYNAIPNYTLAKRWYQMALQVHPRNGRPFNQLAIIAVNQKRPLDVVYYYIRSLTASNPFMSARDSLVSMFEDIRKKYESAQQSQPNHDSEGRREGRVLSGEGLRQEIWIRPDSGATNRRTLSQSNNEDNDAKDELKRLPPEQLMKKFLTSYLHCHGMLFSRVGLDGFKDICIKMLLDFTVLLQTSPPRLSTNHLLQILAINMYAVSNTELKDNRVGSGYRSAAQELALVLAQEMFGCLAKHVVQLLPHNLHHLQPSQPLHHQPLAAADPQRLFTPTLSHFMPPLKAWCDWLLYHSAVWNPPPAVHEYSISGISSDPWTFVAELATILRGLGPPDIVLTDAPSVDTTPVKLVEDSFLRGYGPLIPALRTISYTSLHTHSGRACDWARVMRLQTCLCQFLCGVDPPVLRLQKTDQGDELVSVVDTSPPDTPTASRLSMSTSDVELEDSCSDSEPSDFEEEDVDIGSVEDDTPLASTVRLLTKRKKMLEKKQRQQRKLQTLLEGSVTLEMEVRPRFLVPDTNCFIEHLDLIKALVNSSPYTVMVPLVVLNELDGLSRDAAVAKYGSVGHAVRVREGAATALHYLRDTKPQSLKCVTSQGSVLSSTSFTAEIDMPDATNDDKILSCCVHFCSDSTQRRPIKAGVRRLYREVVLLTEDRNLRVKAHARDVPVRDLLDFAQWAGVR